MDVRTETHSPANGQKGYIVLPPEVDREPEAFLSAKFVIFAVLVLSAAGFGGAVQSGRISMNQFSRFLPGQKAAPFVSATAAAHAAAAAPAKPAVTMVKLDPNAFVVTSISIGQPSFAIINGTSRVQGDPVEAAGVTGWKVKQIQEEAVILQNGSSLASVPLSTPGIKPLDDSLHPLN